MVAASKSAEPKDIVFTDKWWSKVQFQNIGMQLKDKLNKFPSEKTALRKKFKENDDKLSYFDLFSFLEKDLKIVLKIWEQDHLESRLDMMSFAFIEFNEFNEFCLEQGIEWGEKLKDVNLESLYDQKLNLSYKDYIICNDDYYKGTPSILKSEKAALAKVS